MATGLHPTPTAFVLLNGPPKIIPSPRSTSQYYPLSRKQPARMERKPPVYRYFQSAALNPLDKPDPYKSHNVKRKLSNPPNTTRPATKRGKMDCIIKVVVGWKPSNQRTFYLSHSLLARHSKHIRNDTDNNDALELAEFEPQNFQDFVDFCHSNIYSPNINAPSYHPIRTNISAYLLGCHLTSPVFRNAALSMLYNVVSCGDFTCKGVKQSPIRASDVEYMLDTIERGSNSFAADGLMNMVLDAVVSHWTQDDVRGFLDGSYEEDSVGVDEEGASWDDVYCTFEWFKCIMDDSANIQNRTRLLDKLDFYLKFDVDNDRSGEVGEEGRKELDGHVRQERDSGMVEEGRKQEDKRDKREETRGKRIGWKTIGFPLRNSSVSERAHSEEGEMIEREEANGDGDMLMTEEEANMHLR